MRILYFLFIFIITPFTSVLTQTIEYQKRAAQIRSNVWSLDYPELRDYNVPEGLENESAVILARYREIETTARKSNYAKLFFTGNNAGKLFYSDMDRQLIKINDQTALDNYSKFAFKEEEKQKFYRTTNTSINIIGARIIKPDGSIKEVDVSQLAVSVTEGKNDKESYKKLAIPELQINDILDFFICEIYELETFNLPEQFLSFYSLDYPALKYSYRLKFGKNLTIEHRSINNAPKFIKTQDEEGNIVLTAKSDSIMRMNSYEEIRWMSGLRDLPMIRFSVLQNASEAFYKPESARPIGVFEDIPYKTILEDAKGFLAFSKSKLPAIHDTHKKVAEIVNNYKKINPGISHEKLADIIYTALNFEWYSNMPYYYNSATFTLMLNDLLKENNIECKTGFATNKYGARKNEVLSHDDFYYVTTTNENTRYFFLPYRYRVPGEISSALQGESASTYTFNKISVKANAKTSIDGMWGETIIIPETTAEENVNSSRIKVSFDLEDIHLIGIDRCSSWSGSTKEDIQPWLLLFEDWDKEMRKYLNIHQSYIEELDQKKRTRKLIEEVEGTFEKKRGEHIEQQKKEILMYHGNEAEKINNFYFSSLGVTMEKPKLEYHISYIMSGFVRKAGENIILDAGKLIGKQWNPDENERKREINAYLPSRRILENEIYIYIPENYTIDNIEHLNANYSNEYAAFEAKAEIENDTVIIKTKKSYLQAFIPKNKWNNMIEIIDSTNNFYSKTIILKKNQNQTIENESSL